jgi:hypothetical protein
MQFKVYIISFLKNVGMPENYRLMLDYEYQEEKNKEIY